MQEDTKNSMMNLDHMDNTELELDRSNELRNDESLSSDHENGYVFSWLYTFSQQNLLYNRSSGAIQPYSHPDRKKYIRQSSYKIVKKSSDSKNSHQLNNIK